jgi:hypothetical protein
LSIAVLVRVIEGALSSDNLTDSPDLLSLISFYRCSWEYFQCENALDIPDDEKIRIALRDGNI